MSHLSLEECVRKRVSTASPECQEWMDRGLTQMYGFNHEDAIRAFHKALSFDPNCAMAYFCLSHCYSPNYNNVIGLDAAQSREESKKAVELIAATADPSLSEWERALIAAQAVKFADDVSSAEEGSQRQAAAMRRIYQQFSEDVDIAAIFAECLMMLAPWHLWTSPPNAKPAMPETEELVRVLEKGLQIEPTHPALCHYYIHTMELSSTPEAALPAANALRGRVPGQGHLSHMPSHIDVWVGAYSDAVSTNRAACDADESYVAQTGFDNEFYKVYRMHNYHFGAWAAMFDGQFATALRFAEEAEKQLGIDAVTCKVSNVGPAFLDPFASIPWHVLVRFGRWEEIISRPLREEKDLYPATLAVSYYARGVAFAALGRVEEAERERAKFHEAIQDKLLENKYLMNNQMRNFEKSSGILDIAEAVLDGEIEYRKGNYQLAYDHLRLGVKRDIGLDYDEPWAWMVPARHALGALLLEQGHASEAEQVYREDLLMYKDNMWALYGLHMALTQQNKTEEAKTVYAKYEVASARSDVKIGASCFCATKTCGQ